MYYAEREGVKVDPYFWIADIYLQNDIQFYGKVHSIALLIKKLKD